MATHGPYQRTDGRLIIIIDGKTVSYPRYLYEKHHGVKIDPAMEVDHIDDNCLNNDISNLQLLSKSDNVKKQRKNFSPSKGISLSESHKSKLSGSGNGRSKLSEKDVSEIRSFPKTRGFISLLSVKYGVSRKTIENVIKKVSYKNT